MREQKEIQFENPSNSIQVIFELNDQKSPVYMVMHQNKKVLDTSNLGLVRKDGDFSKQLKIVSVTGPEAVSDSYTMQQGKQSNIKYAANKYTVQLQNEGGQILDVIFQLSEDGVAFRYHFPGTSDSLKFINEEKTSFRFMPETSSWLQPMSKAKTGWESTNPSYEEHYLMEVPVNTPSPIGEGWVYPALFNNGDTWMLITESDLHENYCGSRLIYDQDLQSLRLSFPQQEEVFPDGALSPESALPLYSPWRIIAIGNLKTITESTLGTDLASASTYMDTNYIKDGLASWSWALLKDESVNYETTLKFIDYASNMNWPYCLIDVNWDTRIGYDRIEELAKYAAGKGVKLILWYNSSGSWNTTPYHPKSKLLTHADRNKEFSKLSDMGIAGIKVDFFGGDGQSMIAYYHDILKDAASHKLLVNFHGATLPRGWHRTYPNLMTVEAIKGEEFITFTQETADLQPGHCAVIPFTRNVFDPMDFTPMVLDSIPHINRRTTAAFELALPVLFLSGIQHIAEVPEGMAKQPDYVIDYLRDIPTVWDESRYIAGYPGKDVIMARRKNDTWFIVGINGGQKVKEFYLDLSFIEKNEGIMINDDNGGFQQSFISPDSRLHVRMNAYDGFVMKF